MKTMAKLSKSSKTRRNVFWLLRITSRPSTALAPMCGRLCFAAPGDNIQSPILGSLTASNDGKT
jgi:hypothetical protein